MNLKQFQRGGANIGIQATVVQTSLGPILIAATDKGLCHIQFGDNEAALQCELSRIFPQTTPRITPGFERLIETVVIEIDEQETGVDLPLDIRGTAFQCRVWEELGKIPRGETMTYSQLARQIGKPTATRAVAGACAANKIAVVIPCHRVVRSDGGLGGYRWGIERKRSLLNREDTTKVDSAKRIPAPAEPINCVTGN